MASIRQPGMLWLAILWLCTGQLGHAAGKVLSLDMHREAGDPKTGDLVSDRFPSLYWFTNVSVGDSGVLRLSVDTGSTDCLVNPGLYKPSKYRKPYPGKTKLAAAFQGVNRAGYGFVSISGHVQEDIVSAGGFSFKSQALGDITSCNLSAHITSPIPSLDKGSLASPARKRASSGLKHRPGGLIYMTKVTFGKTGLDLRLAPVAKGSILGKFDQDLADGPFYTTKQLDPGAAYFIRGDVYVNGEKTLTDQGFVTDVGTTNIQAPLKPGQAIFDKLKWHNRVTVRDRADVFGTEKVATIESAFFPWETPEPSADAH